MDIAAAGARDDSRGQIVDCNRPMLRALVEETGAEAVDFGIVRDDLGSLREKLTAALTAADIVVSSGGASHGTKDHMKALLAEVGEVRFGAMCMKPGKPTTFATVAAPQVSEQERLVFALPGNPVSCFVTFKLLVVPAVEQLHGRPTGAAVYPRVEAHLLGPVEMDPMRPEYHRAVARWEGGRIVAESTGFQRSSRVASVAAANCFLEIPKGSGVLPEGTVVSALLLPTGGVCGSGLGADPEGYPAPARAPAPPQLAQQLPHTGTREQAAVYASVEAPAGERCVVGIVAAGDEATGAAECARASLHSSGKQLELLLADVPARKDAVCSAVAQWSGGQHSVAPCRVCGLVFIVSAFGLSNADAAITEGIQALLEHDAPNVADLVLRTALACTPLAMLAPLVAGFRNGCLLVMVPAAAAVECVQAIFPLAGHTEAAPS